MPETGDAGGAPFVERRRDNLSLGGLKSVFDWSWKVIPALWLAFQFYFSTADTTKRTAANETKIQMLETEINKLDRDVALTNGDIKALRDQIAMDREFYIRTQGGAKR